MAEEGMKLENKVAAVTGGTAHSVDGGTAQY